MPQEASRTIHLTPLAVIDQTPKPKETPSKQLIERVSTPTQKARKVEAAMNAVDIKKIIERAQQLNSSRVTKYCSDTPRLNPTTPRTKIVLEASEKLQETKISGKLRETVRSKDRELRTPEKLLAPSHDSKKKDLT